MTEFTPGQTQWMQAILDDNTGHKPHLKEPIINITGTFTFASDLNVPAGVTLNVANSSTISLASGKRILCNGTLNANGVTFTRSGASGTWGGIQFNSGSSGTVQYCNINYATYGIYCNNTSQPIITNNNINNAGTYGIWVYNSSPTLSYNIIAGGSNGIYCQSMSNPIVSHNTITGQTYYGLSCFESNARLAETNQGNNIIKFNGSGIASGYNSNISMSNGNNCVHSNTNFEAYAVNTSNIYAVNTCWRFFTSPFYTVTDFLTQNYSYVYANPGLSSDPNGCLNKESFQEEITIVSSAVDEDKEFEYILDLEQKGNYDEAIASYVAKYKKDNLVNVKNYIIGHLAKCYLYSGKKDFIDFLNKEIRKDLKKDDEVYGATINAEGMTWLAARNYDRAIENFMLLKNNFCNNDVFYKESLFNLGSIYLLQLQNSTKAKEFFDELKIIFPEDELTYHSQIQLGEKPKYILPAIKLKKESAKEEEIITELTLQDNYPNPFNPTTNITFTLPQRSNVKLVIYDVLGKEVATLANSVYEAGKYDVTFNASNLPSGVYFYSITTTQGTITKKMLLIK